MKIKNKNLANQYNDLYKKNKSGFLGGTNYSIEKRLNYEIKILANIIKKKFNKKISILSIGCGEFKIEDKLYNLGIIKKIIGIDISSEIIKKNKIKYKDNNNYIFKNIDILEYTFTEKVDLIFFGGVLLYNNNNNIKKILNKILNKSTLIISRDSCSSYKDFTYNKGFYTYYRNKKNYIKIYKKFFYNINTIFNLGYYNIISYDFIKKYGLPENKTSIFLLNCIRLVKNYFKNDLYNYFFIIENDKNNIKNIQ